MFGVAVGGFDFPSCEEAVAVVSVILLFLRM
jgi:hypothetical protein